jgi:hypothetical protein
MTGRGLLSKPVETCRKYTLHRRGNAHAAASYSYRRATTSTGDCGMASHNNALALASVSAGATGDDPPNLPQTLHFNAPGELVAPMFVHSPQENVLGAERYALKGNWSTSAIRVFAAAKLKNECLVPINGPTLKARSKSAFLASKKSHKDREQILVYQARWCFYPLSHWNPTSSAQLEPLSLYPPSFTLVPFSSQMDSWERVPGPARGSSAAGGRLRISPSRARITTSASAIRGRT